MPASIAEKWESLKRTLKYCGAEELRVYRALFFAGAASMKNVFIEIEELPGMGEQRAAFIKMNAEIDEVLAASKGEPDPFDREPTGPVQ